MHKTDVDGFFIPVKFLTLERMAIRIVILELDNCSIFPGLGFHVSTYEVLCSLFSTHDQCTLLWNGNTRSLICILYLSKNFAVAITIILSVLEVMTFHRSLKYTIDTFRFHGRSRAFKCRLLSISGILHCSYQNVHVTHIGYMPD